jgi:hypothetical protein
LTGGERAFRRRRHLSALQWHKRTKTKQSKAKQSKAKEKNIGTLAPHTHIHTHTCSKRDRGTDTRGKRELGFCFQFGGGPRSKHSSECVYVCVYMRAMKRDELSISFDATDALKKSSQSKPSQAKRIPPDRDPPTLFSLAGDRWIDGSMNGWMGWR